MPPYLSKYITNQRLRAVKPHLRGSILDLGCGYSTIPSLLQPGQSYVGVEISTHACDWLTKKYPEHTFFQRDFNQDPLALPDLYDTILMAAVLEHLKAPLNLLGQLSRYLQPDGRVVLTTPTPIGGFIHMVGSRLGMFYQEAADEHEAFYTRKSLHYLADQSGLNMIQYQSFLYFGNQLAIFGAKGYQSHRF